MEWNGMVEAKLPQLSGENRKLVKRVGVVVRAVLEEVVEVVVEVVTVLVGLAVLVGLVIEVVVVEGRMWGWPDERYMW